MEKTAKLKIQVVINWNHALKYLVILAFLHCLIKIPLAQNKFEDEQTD